MKTIFTNLVLLMVAMLMPFGAIHAQHLKIMPDGVVIPKGDHTLVVLAENGQMIYDTVTHSVWFFNNTIWQEVGADNLGDHLATETLEMANELIKNLGTPVDDSDAATKLYVDQHADADADPMNELQTITASTEGDTMYLSNGSWLIVPGLSDANYTQDIDGNFYDKIKIGDQVWMQQSLRVTRYNDGTPIPKAAAAVDWVNLTTGVYCWFENDSLAYFDHGALYNWYVGANTNTLNVCPVGWHVPNKAEAEILATNLGGLDVAGGKIKQAGLATWTSPNTGATNSSGMTFLGTGNRRFDGAFQGEGWLNGIWLNDNNPIYTNFISAYHTYTWYSHDDLIIDDTSSTTLGLKIRCIQDDE